MVHLALLICCGEGCSERFEARGNLAELETLACDCGCGLHVIGWPVPAEAGAASLELVAA